MARLSSLSYINFTPSTTSHPTSDQIPTLITNYYKKVYTYLKLTYSADESTDTYGIIDTDTFRDQLDQLVSHKAQKWNEAGKNSTGDVRPMPIFDLYYEDENGSEDRINQFVHYIDNLVITDDSVDYWDNIRLWSSDYADRSGVY